MIATSVLGVALAPGCSSAFASCLETRTCPPDENPGGAGGAVDSGLSEGGGATAAGSPGESATGGMDSSSEPLAVVETTPLDSTTDVARDQAIEVVFSTDLDATTVTAATFEVTGPNGGVDGDLSVEAAVITFTPKSPWALLADYTVALGAGIGSADNQLLGEKRTFGFRSRDGALGKSQRLSSSKTLNLKVLGNRRGHTVVTWANNEAINSHYSVMFDPASSTWGKVQPVAADAVHDYSIAWPCVSETGDAFVTVSASPPVWNRATAGTWGQHQLLEGGSLRGCALGRDGIAMTVWSEGGNVLTASLSSENEWSPTTTAQSNASILGVMPYATGSLLFFTPTDSKQVFSRVFDAAKWLPAKAVTPADDPGYRSYDSFESTAIFTWGNAASRVNAALFDGTAWTRKDLGPGFAGQTSTLGAARHMVAWLSQGNAYAAFYDVGVGWADPVKLGSSNAEEIGPGTAVDDSGSAFAAWPDGVNIGWRRFSRVTEEWSETQAILDQDPQGVYVTRNASSGDVIIVWANDLGVWFSRFE